MEPVGDAASQGFIDAEDRSAYECALRTAWAQGHLLVLELPTREKRKRRASWECGIKDTADPTRMSCVAGAGVPASRRFNLRLIR